MSFSKSSWRTEYNDVYKGFEVPLECHPRPHYIASQLVNTKRQIHQALEHYSKRLPPDLRENVESTIKDIEKKINTISLDHFNLCVKNYDGTVVKLEDFAMKESKRIRAQVTSKCPQTVLNLTLVYYEDENAITETSLKADFKKQETRKHDSKKQETHLPLYVIRTENYNNLTQKIWKLVNGSNYLRHCAKYTQFIITAPTEEPVPVERQMTTRSMVAGFQAPHGPRIQEPPATKRKPTETKSAEESAEHSATYAASSFRKHGESESAMDTSCLTVPKKTVKTRSPARSPTRSPLQSPVGSPGYLNIPDQPPPSPPGKRTKAKTEQRIKRMKKTKSDTGASSEVDSDMDQSDKEQAKEDESIIDQSFFNRIGTRDSTPSDWGVGGKIANALNDQLENNLMDIIDDILDVAKKIRDGIPNICMEKEEKTDTVLDNVIFVVEALAKISKTSRGKEMREKAEADKKTISELQREILKLPNVAACGTIFGTLCVHMLDAETGENKPGTSAEKEKAEDEKMKKKIKGIFEKYHYERSFKLGRISYHNMGGPLRIIG